MAVSTFISSSGDNNPRTPPLVCSFVHSRFEHVARLYFCFLYFELTRGRLVSAFSIMWLSVLSECILLCRQVVPYHHLDYLMLPDKMTKCGVESFVPITAPQTISPSPNMTQTQPGNSCNENANPQLEKKGIKKWFCMEDSELTRITHSTFGTRK